MTLMTNPEYIKKNQKVPAEIANFFKTSPAAEVRDQLIRDLCENHWTYEAVATACGITRERVRQICIAEPTGAPAVILFDIPTPPLRVEREKRIYIEPKPETLSRLLELQPYAQRVRSYGKDYRQEAEEYTSLLNYAHTVEGVTLYRLAKRLGVTHGALRSRLARYGYKAPKTATSKVYTPIIRENRAI